MHEVLNTKEIERLADTRAGDLYIDWNHWIRTYEATTATSDRQNNVIIVRFLTDADCSLGACYAHFMSTFAEKDNLTVLGPRRRPRRIPRETPRY
jgi:hypothetical protein